MKIEIFDDLMCPGCAKSLAVLGNQTFSYKIGVYCCINPICGDALIEKVYNANHAIGPALINLSQYLSITSSKANGIKINAGAGGAKITNASGSSGGPGGSIYIGGRLGIPEHPIKIGCPTCYSKIELSFEEATEMHKQIKNCKCPNCGTQGHYMSEEFRQRIWKELQK